MKRVKSIHTIASWLLGLAIVFLAVPHVRAAKDFRLRPGAKGKICVSCHDAFEDVLKKRFVHRWFNNCFKPAVNKTESRNIQYFVTYTNTASAEDTFIRVNFNKRMT